MIPKPSEGMEMELKLELDAASMAALGASELLADAPIAVSQRAIYFDTPDQALRRGELSLRIRREGERRVQTVKASGTTALVRTSRMGVRRYRRSARARSYEPGLRAGR
ncbi:CYTH domain-containing protein [Novosphingobium resinovorum]|uniref:CYTH domain-containing protein n=1 Tax=Novosphingobium resinovorum TaxID=158500 RepID=UPI00360EE8BE